MIINDKEQNTISLMRDSLRCDWFAMSDHYFLGMQYGNIDYTNIDFVLISMLAFIPAMLQHYCTNMKSIVSKLNRVTLALFLTAEYFIYKRIDSLTVQK